MTTAKHLIEALDAHITTIAPNGYTLTTTINPTNETLNVHLLHYPAAAPANTLPTNVGAVTVGYTEPALEDTDTEDVIAELEALQSKHQRQCNMVTMLNDHGIKVAISTPPTTAAQKAAAAGHPSARKFI